MPGRAGASASEGLSERTNLLLGVTLAGLEPRPPGGDHVLATAWRRGPCQQPARGARERRDREKPLAEPVKEQESAKPAAADAAPRREEVNSVVEVVKEDAVCFSSAAEAAPTLQTVSHSLSLSLSVSC